MDIYCNERCRNVAIVGNAPVACDQAELIDASDVVVRCDLAMGVGMGRGTRTDQLVLRNWGPQMEGWLREGTIERSPVFSIAREVCLSVHPGYHALIDPPLGAQDWRRALRQDWTGEATERYISCGKWVSVYTAAFYARSVLALGYPMTRDAPVPTTAYLAARWWVERSQRQSLCCHAFGIDFQSDRRQTSALPHDHQAERAWFNRAARAGELTMHPLRTSQEAPIPVGAIGHHPQEFS